ncbi:DUF7344 domain-containing protein [Halovivax gelatinilyticus]|uniref:DUF7344 domain-containing protein n=1 Tax=Halovivax gelatinilyticus TaxID=2961597 RepID=UPI0020CA2F8E|nr:hypothetical protein [Halovivax gelatinilyticus]
MVTVDDVLSLLNDERRRYALYFLSEQDRPVPIDEVVRAVAEMETGSDGEPDESTIRDVELSFHHNHLDRADRYEFVYYNRTDQTIEMYESPTKFDVMLTVAEVFER